MGRRIHLRVNFTKMNTLSFISLFALFSLSLTTTITFPGPRRISVINNGSRVAVETVQAIRLIQPHEDADDDNFDDKENLRIDRKPLKEDDDNRRERNTLKEEREKKPLKTENNTLGDRKPARSEEIERRETTETVTRDRNRTTTAIPISERIPRRRGSQRNECNEKEDLTEVVEDSFHRLMLVGDRDILLSNVDEHQEEHCDDARKNLREMENHVKCVQGNHRDLLDTLLNGFRKAVKQRCESKCWHDEFIEFSQCMKNEEVKEAFHACSDRAYVAYAYILKNIPEKDQLKATCCVYPYISDCILNATLSDCNEDNAYFSVKTVLSPISGARALVCDKNYLEDCKRKAEVDRALNRIFNARVRPKHRGFYKLYLKIAENQLSVESLR